MLKKVFTIELFAQYAALLFLLALITVFTILEPRFLHPLNIFNILRQVSIFGLIAVGMTFVILTTGIDLSVGSLLALCGLVGAYVAKGGLDDRFALGAGVESGNSALMALAAAIVIGLIGGAIQGTAITKLRVPPFVVTLGGLTAFRGAALLFSGGGPISGFAPDYTWWGQGKIGIVPIPVIIFLVFAVIAHIALKYTRFGMHIYAVGGNEAAAGKNGIRANRVIMMAYIIIGFFCGLAGFLLSARLSSAEAVAGLGLELTVIASVVIGGTSLFGGIGSIFGTVIGACLIGVLTNGLVLLNVSSFVQQIVIGVILVSAVAIDQYASERRRK